MGRRLRVRPNRTALAVLLTVVAVALPNGTWLVAGSRGVEREAELKRKNVSSFAYKKGIQLAERLSARLANLLNDETDRAFYEYQNLYHDPRGASVGDSVSISPLAKGPTNPYVWRHFQVDETGRLSLPTLNAQYPELGAEPDPKSCQALKALRDVSTFCTRGYDASTRCPIRIVTAADEGGKRKVHAEGGEPRAIHHVEDLGLRAWKQHLAASTVYADIKRGGKRAPSTLRRGEDPERVYVVVSEFDWFTLPIDGQPGLVALRAIDTPVGAWNQGFVISLEAVGDYLKASHYPARFVPLDLGAPATANEILLGVGGTNWAVSLDIGEQLAEVSAWATRERSRFLRIVLLCALAASLAGIAMVLLVHQSERLAAQRAQFAASAAHELRTPLAGLRLYSEMLAEGLGDPTRSQRYANRLAGEAERLGRVVTNVLSFTRLERQTLRLDPQPGDLADAVRAVYEHNRPAIETAGVVLELDIPDDLPSARFDRDAVTHIVQNLLDNAEKYTREVVGRTIRVGLVATARAVILTVTDNGAGISRDLRKKLFRPFVRGNDDNGAEGLGLGLVLVRALAVEQGGSIRYSDAPGGGARFAVKFPVA